MSQFAKLFEAVKAEPKKGEIKKKTVKNAGKTASNKTESAKKTLKLNESLPLKNPSARLKENAASEEIQTSPKSFPHHQKPIGKSRDADYTQVLTYIRKETHREIKKILIDDANKRNLSDLVEELLSGWLSKNSK